MDILKYFYEEPVALEALTPDLNPDARRRAAPSLPFDALLTAPHYYRGYLAGTNLDTGRVGLTALRHPEAFIDPLMDWLGSSTWLRALDDGTTEPVIGAALPLLLQDPGPTAVLACAEAPLPGKEVTATVRTERRYALPALRRLLSQARVAFFPEPAHHGSDWSFFSAHPMREALVAAFHRHPVEGVRRFALPFQKARSEHRFYFESWQLDAPLPDFIEEL